jgi:hypothetical protein
MDTAEWSGVVSQQREKEAAVDTGQAVIVALACHALLAYSSSLLGIFGATRVYAAITKTPPPTINLLSRPMLGTFGFVFAWVGFIWHPC